MFHCVVDAESGITYPLVKVKLSIQFVVQVVEDTVSPVGVSADTEVTVPEPPVGNPREEVATHLLFLPFVWRIYPLVSVVLANWYEVKSAANAEETRPKVISKVKIFFIVLILWYVLNIDNSKR